MTGLLRIELRRSLALAVAALFAVLGTVMYYAGANQGGGWIGAALQQRAMLGVLWAFALAAGAAQARRERRRRTEELIATTAAPRWRRVLPTAAALAMGVAAGYLLMFLGAAVHLLPTASYFAAGSVPVVAVGALSVIAAAWLGMAIGARIPWPLTPPLLAVASVVLLFIFPAYVLGVRHGAEPSGLLLLSPVLQPANGLVTDLITVTGRTNLLQATWFGALAIGGLITFAAATTRTRVAAVMPILVGLGLTLPQLPQQAADAFGPDHSAAALVCDDTTPRVCVTKVHAAALNDLREPAQQALRILSAKLAQPPTSVVEEFRPQQFEPGPQSADTVLIGLEVTPSGHLTRTSNSLLWQLLSGAGTRPCRVGSMPADVLTRYFTARLVAAAWLLDQPPATAPDEPARQIADLSLASQAFEHLRSLPIAQQQARISALRQAEISCTNGDLLEQLR